MAREKTKESTEETTHRINFSIPVGTDYETALKDVPSKYKETVKTYKDIQTMREVMAHDGKNILEKIDNTLKDWEKERVVNEVHDAVANSGAVCATPTCRYKLKYR